LDGSLGLDDGDGGVDILGDYVSTVHETASHVLSVSGVALGHHVGGLEDGVGDLSNGELLVVGLLGGDHGGIRAKHKVDARVGHQVSLELSDIDVQGTIETERGSQGRDDLSNQSVKVGVGGSIDVEGSLADIVDGLIVEHEGNISVLEERVGREHRVVRLNYGSGHLGGGVDAEIELGFLSVVNGESLKEERTETRSCSTTNGVEDEETLETSALIGQLSHSVKAEVDNFLTNGVMTTGIVVGGIFLSSDELLGVEQLTVGSSPDLIDHSGLQIQEDGTGNVLAGTSLREEGVEGIISITNGLVGGHLSIRLDSVLQAIELPAGISDLGTSLSNVD